MGKLDKLANELGIQMLEIPGRYYLLGKIVDLDAAVWTEKLNKRDAIKFLEGYKQVKGDQSWVDYATEKGV